MYVKLVLNTSNIYFILNRHYLISTAIIYTVILGFMIVGVISMGTEPAFQLYAPGMLACISYNGYLHKRVLNKELPLVLLFAIHVICYAGVYIYSRFNEPLYDAPQTAVNILIAFNSAATFSIVIIYTYLFHYVAIDSEEKLEKTALLDNLTGLYNRHYLISYLDRMDISNPDSCWLGLLDIDDFKKVNDTYGHNCGDYILHQVATLAQQTCKECIVCRWGGEEFIILSTKKDAGTDLLEKLRKRINDLDFRFEDRNIKITVTIGATHYTSDLPHNLWISKADKNLYYGKENGKNQVVIE